MGQILAILTALIWAGAVILYKKSVVQVTPLALNFFKNSVALILLIATVLVLGQADLQAIAPGHLLLMLASGVIGIGVSDTLLFMTLRRLGASRTALIDCLYSPFVILFSFMTVGETIGPTAIVAGVLILGSVVVSSREGFGGTMSRKDLWMGCLLGASAMATVAYAVVMMKPILHTYPLTLMTAVRMTGGLASLVLALPFHPDRKSVREVFRPQPAWRWMLAGTFLGSYLSIITWLAGFKYSQAGVVALLNQTSTVWIVILAAIFLKEPLTRLKVLAVAMAFAGAAIIFY